jgi:hypothetical protein
VTFYIDSILVSAQLVLIEWRAEGPDDQIYDDSEPVPGFRLPRGPHIVRPDGLSAPLGGTYGVDREDGSARGTAHLFAAGPGDYEIVFGDPEISKARWPFTIP